jgi:CheY-like chemotaxis protein
MTSQENNRPPAIDPGGPAAQTRGKVLVVEDVALIRTTLVEMVEQFGFEAAEAGDAREALALLGRDAAITVLLTDLGLPGMSGHELVAEARKLKPDLKVIIASGYSNSAGLPGTNLVKPFDPERLRQMLEN